MSSASPVSVVSLCGVSVRAESLRTLAGRLEDDQLGEKLERAVANDNTIVALSFAERQQIVDALEQESATAGLAGLRAELNAQLKRHRDHLAKVERTDRYREIEARRRAATQEPSGISDTSNGGHARKHASERQPDSPSSMLSPCVTPGCNTLTMGGTCVEHDPPVQVVVPRGR